MTLHDVDRKVNYGELAREAAPWLDSHAGAETVQRNLVKGNAGTYFYEGKLQPKERGRVGKAGQVYSAPETRKFETSVKEWAKRLFKDPVHYPLEVSLTLYEKTDDKALITASALGLIYNDHGDIDNYVKAIFDGLNKVAWRDDKQINTLCVKRRWSTMDGFSLRLWRNGLSKLEYAALLRQIALLADKAPSE